MSEQEAEQWVENLQKQGIKMVVFDFDHTIAKGHSGHGVPLKQIPLLSLHGLSGDFLRVVPILYRRGIVMRIASWAQATPFTPVDALAGGPLILAVLKPWFSHIYPSHIIGVHSPTYKDLPPGKLFHLNFFRSNCNLEPCDVLLVDDDFTTLRIAVEAGYRGFWVKEGKGFDIATGRELAPPAPKKKEVALESF